MDYLSYLVGVLITFTQLGTLEPIKPTREDLTFSVVIVMASQKQTFETCQRFGLWPEVNFAELTEENVGCSTFNTQTKACTLYVSRPRHVDDQNTSTWGHELLHCAFGKYHPI